MFDPTKQTFGGSMVLLGLFLLVGALSMFNNPTSWEKSRVPLPEKASQTKIIDLQR